MIINPKRYFYDDRNEYERGYNDGYKKGCENGIIFGIVLGVISTFTFNIATIYVKK